MQNICLNELTQDPHWIGQDEIVCQHQEVLGLSPVAVSALERVCHYMHALWPLNSALRSWYKDRSTESNIVGLNKAILTFQTLINHKKGREVVA
jgi:hypothetical protein